MDPEDIFDEGQLARYYAVQAAGGVRDSTPNAGSNVIAVAQWIIEGDNQ